MFGKAVQTENNWAFAYEVPMGGYAICIGQIGFLPVLEEEPEFATVQELEIEMERIAPLSTWCGSFFEHLFTKAGDPYS